MSGSSQHETTNLKEHQGGLTPLSSEGFPPQLPPPLTVELDFKQVIRNAGLTNQQDRVKRRKMLRIFKGSLIPITIAIDFVLNNPWTDLSWYPVIVASVIMINLFIVLVSRNLSILVLLFVSQLEDSSWEVCFSPHLLILVFLYPSTSSTVLLYAANLVASLTFLPSIKYMKRVDLDLKELQVMSNRDCVPLVWCNRIMLMFVYISPNFLVFIVYLLWKRAFKSADLLKIAIYHAILLNTIALSVSIIRMMEIF